MSAFFMSLKYYIPAALWAIVIFIIIAIPGSYIPKPHGLLELLSPDKLVHLGMFAPFAYLIRWGQQKTGIKDKRQILFPLIFGITYAVTTELLQFYVITGRNGNIYDALADILGIILGLVIFNKINKTEKDFKDV